MNKKALQDLIEISRFYGRQKDYALAGGGNTSWKNDEIIWVKASGASLAEIDEDGFAVLFREKVRVTGTRNYSRDVQLREMEVKQDLEAASVDPSRMKRPSVETSFHELIRYAYVIHMHPTLANALLCSQNARLLTREYFGDEVMYIESAPGYELFKKVSEEMKDYRIRFNRDPHIIFLENHGVFVSADTTQEVKSLYDHIINTIASKLSNHKEITELPISPFVSSFLPALRMMVAGEDRQITARIRHNSLHRYFYSNHLSFAKCSLPLTPDIIVYCKSAYLYLENTSTPESIIGEFRLKLEEYRGKYKYDPKIVMIRDYGIIAFEESAMAAETVLDVFEDLLKISYYSENFGGAHFMSEKDINFIDTWEAENYRRKVSKGSGSGSPSEQRVVVITGGAQGFGGGLAEMLVSDGANVVIADLNKEVGQKKASELKALCRKNDVFFVEVNVADPDSVSALVEETVKHFGGIDVFISNAGILHAGGLDEMDPATFSLMTKVNYEGYFNCAKIAGAVMRLQSAHCKNRYFDLVQINSKSGLRGSNRNFAYAGGKFGGIGLTQSFALELAPYRIKVNAICPGNFFEGPLWSDPEKGLFVQYLRAGKVPGAKTIEDVKHFYEKQVPMGRGCRVEDVLKALYYIMVQNYETGQAIPVTGGQVMLN